MDVLIKDRVKVEWVELGEGVFGDYNKSDPDDVELLRFDVSYKNDDGEWEDAGDASYCTLMPASADAELREKGLNYIMNEVFDHANVGYSIKKTCERLSWVGPHTFQKGEIS